MTTITLKNNNNHTFTARLVKQGEPFGLNGRLINENPKPKVEFIDVTRPDSPQLMPAYYLETLKEIPPQNGLVFFSYEPDWGISADNMQKVVSTFS